MLSYTSPMDNWPTLNSTVEAVLGFCFSLVRTLGVVFCPWWYHLLEPSEERDRRRAGPAAFATLTAVLVLLVWAIPEARLKVPALQGLLRPECSKRS